MVYESYFSAYHTLQQGRSSLAKPMKLCRSYNTSNQAWLANGSFGNGQSERSNLGEVPLNLGVGLIPPQPLEDRAETQAYARELHTVTVGRHCSLTRALLPLKLNKWSIQPDLVQPLPLLVLPYLAWAWTIRNLMRIAGLQIACMVYRILIAFAMNTGLPMPVLAVTASSQH